jgi:DNA-binding CsgD family transcriptional regulator
MVLMSTAASNPGPLLGREAEVELLASLLDGISDGGGALVLSGEPGIGKSRLLAVAAGFARERGFTVLSTAGVQSEAHLPFAGLHQLLRPLRFRAADLPARQRAALDAAFGLGDEPAPERFQIAMAVLDLLGEVATDAPLLVLAEDAQWLDRPTTEVLSFVARRLQSDPIVLIAAVREGYPSLLVDAGLPQHHLGGLTPADAMTLLDASAQQLSPAVRDRLLSDAAGNPLALTELPITAARLDPITPGSLPLTQRLEQAFAARVSDLPAATRLLLLVAALSDDERLSDIVDAASAVAASAVAGSAVAGSAVAGSTLGLELLEPAAEAGIIDLDLHTVRFRHPLIRSAVRQSASLLQRRRVHEALAEVLRAEPDRRVWHHAALISGTHEEIANELEEAAGRARRRGALAVAVTALQRAAELSPPGPRAGRLLAAAELAFELGQRDLVMPILREVDQLDPDPVQRARATWIEELVQTRPLGDAPRAAALIAAAEQAGQAGDRDLQLNLAWLIASRAWLVDPAPTARRVLIEAADRLGDPESADLRILAIQAYADPFGKAPAILKRLREAAADVHRDADAARFLGPAAVAVGAFDVAATFLGEAVEGLRTQGRLGHLPRMLTLQGRMAAQVADWGVAIPAAEEARRLAAELREPHWVAAADAVISVIAGMRGDQDAAERAAAQAERIAVPAGANLTIAFAQFGRILAALGAGRHSDAYQAAERLLDPASPAHHPVIACWLIGDLAEAALHTGRIDEARARVKQVEAASGDIPGTCIAVGLLHARALLAQDPEQAADRFDEAFGTDLAHWPLQRARLLLAYGQWLRRQRRIAESRAPLRDARDAFDAMGCAPWGDQARRELRASGESSRRRDLAASDQLTAQELQIAQLAAQGLSNRDIAQRLYLSHRTISTHLYRIFPKLGITSRGELRSALGLPGDPRQLRLGLQGDQLPAGDPAKLAVDPGEQVPARRVWKDAVPGGARRRPGVQDGRRGTGSLRQRNAQHQRRLTIGRAQRYRGSDQRVTGTGEDPFADAVAVTGTGRLGPQHPAGGLERAAGGRGVQRKNLQPRLAYLTSGDAAAR